MSIEARSSGTLAVVVTRLAGLWILAGALFKLFLGAPTDLPRVIQELPPDLPLTFRVVIAAELTVGLLSVLKPRWSWLLLMALLALFHFVLITQIQEKAASCGCFGRSITIPPAWMLAIDSVVLLLLLLSRPWRSAGRDAVSLTVLVLALGAVIPLPWILDREAQGNENPSGSQWTVVDPTHWVGQPIADTELAQWIDVSALPPDGVWVLWRQSCEVCADLFLYVEQYEFGDRPLVLIEMPERDIPDDERHVHELPRGEHVHIVSLPDDGRRWLLQTPGVFVLRRGCVLWARRGATLDDWSQTRDPPPPPGCR